MMQIIRNIGTFFHMIHFLLRGKLYKEKVLDYYACMHIGLQNKAQNMVTLGSCEINKIETATESFKFLALYSTYCRAAGLDFSEELYKYKN